MSYGKQGTQGIEANLTAGKVKDGFGDIDTVSGIDEVRGTSFNDIFIGSDADIKENFRGYDGDDIFDGKKGADKFYGGEGKDTFKFAADDGADTIKDFSTGNDKMSFTTLNSMADFTSVVTENGDTVISYGIDSSVTLSGIASVTADDFIFA